MARKKTENPLLEIEPESVDSINAESTSVPADLSVSDECWSDLALSEFSDTELFNGRPTLDGLRRVTEKMLGPIVLSEASPFTVAVVKQKGTSAEPFYTLEGVSVATCSVTVALHNGGTKTYKEIGESNDFNTDPLFKIYSLPIAASRAEARALRKMLGLRRVISSEEVPSDTTNDRSEDSLISDSQRNMIVNVLAPRCGVDPNKMLTKVKDISKLTYEQARKMIKMLNGYQQDDSTIPDNIKL